MPASDPRTARIVQLGAGIATPSREHQQRARIFGVLFAVTFVTSIAALLLYDPVLYDPNYILSDGADTARSQSTKER